MVETPKDEPEWRPETALPDPRRSRFSEEILARGEMERRNAGSRSYVEEGPRRRLTKARYMQLNQIASDLVDWLRQRGVTREEGCTIDALANQMWPMPTEEVEDK